MAKEFRYQPKEPTKLVAHLERPPTLDLTATDVAPMVTDVMREAATRATAEEALAVAIDLWADLMALEDTERKNYRKRTSGTDAMLTRGQIMGVKGALDRHLKRHRKGS